MKKDNNSEIRHTEKKMSVSGDTGKEFPEEKITVSGDTGKELPEDLLSEIFSRLPFLSINRLRIVCKRWNYLLSNQNQVFRAPAFLIKREFYNGGRAAELWCAERNSVLFKLPMKFQPFRFKNFNLLPEIPSSDNITGMAVKSGVCCVCVSEILCCYHDCTDHNLYICNPAIGNLKKLPRPSPWISQGSWYRALVVGSDNRRFSLLLGHPSLNGVKMEIYDSQTDRWTIHVFASAVIRPRGIGVYSKGNIYWKNNSADGVAVFNLEQRTWKLIGIPFEYQRESDGFAWCLTGNDGRVILTTRKNDRMWKLNEDNGQWHRVPISGRDYSLRVEMGLHDVAVNKEGSILMHSHGNNQTFMFDANGRLVQNFEFPVGFEDSQNQCISIYPFEISNEGWP